MYKINIHKKIDSVLVAEGINGISGIIESKDILKFVSTDIKVFKKYLNR